MQKLSVFLFICISAVLADISIVENPNVYLDLPDNDVSVSHPDGFKERRTGVKAAPDTPTTSDNGKGNWGDNLWSSRTQGDQLELRGIIINPVDNLRDQIFDLKVKVPAGKTITHMRFINIGRQRAWVGSVRNSGKAEGLARVFVYKREQVRLLVEVYAK